MSDCKTIQKMIDDFDNNRLSIEDEEMFINHMNTCKDCREELEIHYIIEYGLQDDDDIKNVDPQYRNYLDSYDFKGFMKLKLKNCNKQIRKYKKISNINKLSWICANICILLALAVFIIIEYL